MVDQWRATGGPSPGRWSGPALGPAAVAGGDRAGRKAPTSAARRRASFPKAALSTKRANLWFVAIGSGWISYLTSDGKLVPAFNCNPPPELGQTCEPQGGGWFDGKLYLTTRHRGILTYDPQTKEVKTLVCTYRNQPFKGPNDLDIDADGNLFFTDPGATRPWTQHRRPHQRRIPVFATAFLRKIIDDMLFPNGIAVSPDNNVLAIGDFNAGRLSYGAFMTGPTMGCPQ